MNSDTHTLLVLSEMGIPRYSARGLDQTLAPIAAAGVLRRTINGDLADFSYAPFRKYASKITCRDQRAPAIDGIWPGQVLTVACVAELSHPESSPPQRTPVSGSQRSEDGFVFYRPVLTMMVTAVNTQLDEWAADVQWELELEEI